MAVFRGDYHLDRAIEACLAVMKQIDKLPNISEELHFQPKVSIGINSGEMISGNIGSASLRRLGLYSYRGCGKYGPATAISSAGRADHHQ